MNYPNIVGNYLIFLLTIGDEHAKNFSYLLDYDNNWKFALAYDLTFSYGQGGEYGTTYLNE